METIEQLPLILNPGRILFAIAVILMCAAFIGYFVYRVNRDGNPSEIAEVRTLNERLNNKYDELFRQHDKLQTEFESYKKNESDKYNRLNSLYESEKPLKKELNSRLWQSRREVRKLKKDLIDAARQISDLGGKYSKADRDRADNEAMYASVLADYAEMKVKYEKAITDHNGWVVMNKEGYIYHHHKPIKVNGKWHLARKVNQGVAWALCGRVPEVSDTEPTPVTNKLSNNG